MNKKYFALEKFEQNAVINIYGDITSWPWFEGDTSAVNLSKQLDALGDVNQIDVYINSYGGEVAEGLAIYNALRRHEAKVVTHCDGFACSIASVIFMAGDERVMSEASLLMIHNAWAWAEGNADQLRKQADDLEKITQASVEAYKAHSSISEEEIKTLMDAETWILPSEALEYGFATAIEDAEVKGAKQSAWKQLFEALMAYRQAEETEEEEAEETTEDETEDETEETSDETEISDDEEETSDEEAEQKVETPAQKWSGFFNAILK